ncbi:MAG: SulP family inorganic anion transporter, partial [Bryobacterales bacterium]
MAALAVPEVMGYAKIAGLPAITGLYTILVPMVLFGLFGSSRHLVVGADSATAAILAAGLAGLASMGSAEYVSLAGGLALMAAGFLFAARILRLGFLADFLSRTVLVGFLTGVGVQVALGQIPGMLGFAGAGNGAIPEILYDWRQLGETRPEVLAISISVLVIAMVAKRASKRLPGALIAVAAAIAASWALDAQSHGIQVLGAVPSGLPPLGLPQVDWSWALIEELIPTAFSMFVVILAQSAATSRAYADRYEERFDENVDLVGLGMANVGAALTGGFVVNGSPTKTQMVDSAGGRTQIAQLAAAVVVLVILLFLTGALAYLPEAALSSVVFLIGAELIDFKGMRTIYKQRPWEFGVASIAAAVVAFRGVEEGMPTAIVLSLLAHTRHGYRPKNLVLAGAKDGRWRGVPVSEAAQLVPGLLVYRFTHSMYYANAEFLSDQIRSLVDKAQPPLSWFCIDAGAIDDVDFTAAETLLVIAGFLRKNGIRLVLAE